MQLSHIVNGFVFKYILVIFHNIAHIGYIIKKRIYRNVGNQAKVTLRRHQHAYTPRRIWRIIMLAAAICCCQPAFSTELTPDQIKEIQNVLVYGNESPNWFVKYAHILSPIAILLSMGGALISAYCTIKSNRKISKQRSTFEYLSRLNWDKDFIDSRRMYLELKAGDKKIRFVAEEYHRMRRLKCPPKEELSKIIKQHAAIIGLLNEYEAIAIGIKTDTLDENIIKLNRKSTIIDTIKTCDEFIEVTKKNADTIKNPEKIFCECDELLKKWNNH